jgi:hypothetical protein
LASERAENVQNNGSLHPLCDWFYQLGVHIGDHLLHAFGDGLHVDFGRDVGLRVPHLALHVLDGAVVLCQGCERAA